MKADSLILFLITLAPLPKELFRPYNAAAMPDLHTPEKVHQLPIAVIKNVITLSTSGFGLVVALAWNNVIQRLVEDFINPYFGKNSGIISLFLYALVVTIFAVIITMQLVMVQQHLEYGAPAKKSAGSRQPSRSR